MFGHFITHGTPVILELSFSISTLNSKILTRAMYIYKILEKINQNMVSKYYNRITVRY